jgi:hypothetical protein
MKKFLKILIGMLVLIVIFIGIYIAGQYNLFNKSPTKAVTNTVDKIQLEAYKEQDLKQQMENERLKNIITQNLIDAELHKSDKHVLLETNAKWQGVIPKDAFISWFDNNLHLEIPYTVQIQYDTTNIEVADIDSNTAYINANIANQFKIVVILDGKNIKQAKDKTWFAVDFSSEDLAKILKVVQSEVEEKYANDENAYNQCVEGLQEYIFSIGKMFGREVKITLVEE